MVTDIIHHNSEQLLLVFIEQIRASGEHWSALYFQTSQLLLKPSENEVIEAISPAVNDLKNTLYILKNSDIIIVCKNTELAVLELMRSRLYESLGLTQNNLHTYYDLSTPIDCGKLEVLCQKKMHESSLAASANNNSDAFLFVPSAEETQNFRAALYKRNFRAQPEILIVEDQPFSAKLLSGLLYSSFAIHKAVDAKKAWKLYLEHAPNIVFLDIEMPEINGHQLAQEINKLDPKAFIVMVTGNHDEDNLMQAQNNGVKGFIAKPFNKQRIFDSIQKYTHTCNPNFRKSHGRN